MGLKNVVVKENHRVELEIEVDAVAFDAAVQRAYEKNVGSINIPGFRKGKAPRKMIEQMYGKEVFYEDAANDPRPFVYSSLLSTRLSVPWASNSAIYSSIRETSSS